MSCIIGDESRIGFPIAAFFFAGFCPCGQCACGFGYFALAGSIRLRFFSSPAFALAGNAPAASAISPLRAQYACAFFLRRLLPLRAMRLRLRLSACADTPARRSAFPLRVNCGALSPFCAEAQCGLRAPALSPLRAQCACAAPLDGARFRMHQRIKFAASRYFLS